MGTDSRKIIGYCRVSTTKQGEAWGLTAQLAGLEAWSRFNWSSSPPTRETIDAIVSDDVATTRKRRPALETLLLRAEAGEVKTIVVTGLDRLCRSLGELLEISNRLERAGAELVSIREAIDTSTPTGRFMRNMFGAMAELEREIISERTRAGLEAAFAAGKQKGRPRLVPPDQERLILRLRRQGLTLANISAELERRGLRSPSGGPTWHTSTLSEVCARANVVRPNGRLAAEATSLSPPSP